MATNSKAPGLSEEQKAPGSKIEVFTPSGLKFPATILRRFMGGGKVHDMVYVSYKGQDLPSVVKCDECGPAPEEE